MNNRFRSVSLDIKQPLFNKISDSYLREEKPTRKSVTAASGASAASVGKFMSALVECKLAYEVSRPQKGGGRACLHQTLCDELITLVIDLSSSRFSAAVFDNRFQCTQFESHSYDSALPFNDNLLMLLSRTKENARLRHYRPCVVAVILAEPRIAQVSFGGLPVSSFLPTQEDKPVIDALIKKLFGITPELYCDVTEAISDAVKYRALQELGDIGRIAYVHIGTQMFALGLGESESPLICRLSNLLTDGDRCATELYSEAISARELDSLVLRAVNLMSCVTESDAFVIETEPMRFNTDMTRAVKKAFALTGGVMPLLITRRSTPSVASFGAAKAAIARLICSHLLSDKDRF
ncbi:MAG: hypothetical protein IJY39_05740 [Clostridia bacterium]|nr:hypothetical protein [Clostridia bacterium]